MREWILLGGLMCGGASRPAVGPLASAEELEHRTAQNSK